MVVASVVRTLAVLVWQVAGPGACCVNSEHWTRPEPDNQQLAGLVIHYIIALPMLSCWATLLKLNSDQIFHHFCSGLSGDNERGLDTIV